MFFVVQDRSIGDHASHKMTDQNENNNDNHNHNENDNHNDKDKDKNNKNDNDKDKGNSEKDHKSGRAFALRAFRVNQNSSSG